MSWFQRYRPLSLRARFLLACSAIVLFLSLSYGMVAVLGYVVSFDKNTYRVMRGESNLFFTLAQWQNNRLTIAQPERMTLNFPTLVFIYDEQGKLLWQQRDVPEIRAKIQHQWLLKPDFYEIDTSNRTSAMAIGNDLSAQKRLHAIDNDSNDTFTHSVAVNRYDATTNLPALTIVVVDSIPQELQHSDVVWSWFSYVLAANLILVIPLLWLAAHWSLRPIGHLATQIRELETSQRENLDDAPPQELRSLVRNLNLLLSNERQRYTRYRTTLSDLTHSLKTPLAVLQSTLRSLRNGKDLTIEQAEPVMLEQISRISQQIGYYGDKNDFMEVLGNVLDNACKYCLEFIEVSARQTDQALHLFIDDDGPGIPESKRDLVFVRGQRADTLRPGQGLGLAVALDILEQYKGQIIATSSPLGGARMEVIFRQQEVEHRRE